MNCGYWSCYGLCYCYGCQSYCGLGYSLNCVKNQNFYDLYCCCGWSYFCYVKCLGDCYYYYERYQDGCCYCCEKYLVGYCVLYLVVCYVVYLELGGWLKVVCLGEYLVVYDVCYCFWCQVLGCCGCCLGVVCLVQGECYEQIYVVELIFWCYGLVMYGYCKYCLGVYFGQLVCGLLLVLWLDEQMDVCYSCGYGCCQFLWGLVYDYWLSLELLYYGYDYVQLVIQMVLGDYWCLLDCDQFVGQQYGCWYVQLLLS